MLLTGHLLRTKDLQNVTQEGDKICTFYETLWQFILSYSNNLCLSRNLIFELT